MSKRISQALLYDGFEMLVSSEDTLTGRPSMTTTLSESVPLLFSTFHIGFQFRKPIILLAKSFGIVRGY